MKKLLLIIVFMLFIPFITKAESYNAIVTNPEGAIIYTDEFGSLQEVSVLEYESVIFVTDTTNNKARLEGYDDYSFVYLSDIRRVDDLKELGLEDEPQEEIHEIMEPDSELQDTYESNHLTDYIICIVAIGLIVGLIIFKNKKKNEAY